MNKSLILNKNQIYYIDIWLYEGGGGDHITLATT